MTTYTILARDSDGNPVQFAVQNIDDPLDAREFVRKELPNARPLLLVIPGGRADEKEVA